MEPETPPVPATTPAGVSPTVVGLLRGLVYAGIAAGASGLVAAVGSLDAETLGHYGWLVPVALAGARALEGYIDKRRGQAPQVATGSKPADPTAYAPTATAVLEVAPSQLELEDRAARVTAAVESAMPRAGASTVERVSAAVLAAMR